MRALLALALLLAACSGSRPPAEDPKDRTANFLFACFLERGHNPELHRKKGIPDSAKVTLKLRTDDEGRVTQGQVVKANFPADLVAPCIEEQVPGVLAATAAGTVDGAKLTVNFEDGKVAYQFLGAGGIEHHGTVSPKHKKLEE